MVEKLTPHRAIAEQTLGKPQPHRRRARAYLTAFIAAGLLSLALFYGALAALHASHRLVPPPVSGTWCIDSRFAWLRETPQWKKADLIAVGSSVTWRNLDFSVTPKRAKRDGIVNAAPCFLTVNQTRYLAEYLVQRGTPKTLMTVLAPRDFEGCSRNRTAFFDPDIADQFIEGSGYEWWLYFRNFRLRDVVMHALDATERRNLTENNDQFGSGPLLKDVPDVGRPFKPEAQCYAELTQLAKFLASRDIQFIVATLPVMPGWARLYDDAGTAQAEFKSAIETALASTKAILVDGMSQWSIPDSGFTDPAHLQWPQTADFTRFVWSAALYKGARLPPLKRTAPRSARPDNEHSRIRADDDRWGHLISNAALVGPLTDLTLAGLSAKENRSRRSRRGKPQSRRQESPPVKEIHVTTPMLDAISQNTIGYSEGYPLGVPRSYSWCSGSYKPLNSSVPPPDFTAVTGWGQVYPKAGSPAYSNPDAIIEIANAKTYVHLKTGKWMLVQDQATNQIAGGHFVTDFSGNAGYPMTPKTRPDGSIAFAAPPSGYNDHFWHAARGTYVPGTVDGVYVEMDIRTNDPKMNLIANIGADWWRDARAEYVQGFANNPGAGMSNWVQISTEWSTLRFYSWSTAQLQADPPPPLTKPESQSRSNFTRRFSVSTIYCLPAPRAQTQ